MKRRLETEDVRCEECGEDADISLPRQLIESCHSGTLVLFVGAGASTESHNVLPTTFYDEIAELLGADGSALSFPDLMQEYVSQESRSALINRFVERQRYIDSFPHIRERAVRFHKAVAQIPFLRELITTNWDVYFEQEADSISLIQGADFDYWDLPQRKVLKIHGSLASPGSVIATRNEYERCLVELKAGALGATVHHLLATRTVVFVGYSLRDRHIREIIEVLREDLGTAARRCYFVHPSQTFISPLPGAQVLRTTAGRFIELLDLALVQAEYLLPLAIYERLDQIHDRVAAAQQRFDKIFPPWIFPLAIYNTSYTDGLLDAIGHASATRRSGTDRRHGELIDQACAYHDCHEQARRRKEYWHAAYIEGYENALVAFGAVDIPIGMMPLYYCPGVGAVTTIKRVGKAVRSGARSHRGAYRWAARKTSHLPDGMYLHHPAYLPEGLNDHEQIPHERRQR